MAAGGATGRLAIRDPAYYNRGIPVSVRGFSDALDAYMRNWNGLLNIIETVADLCLFVTMWFSTLELNAQTYLYNFAMGYSTNGVVIMVASLLSYGTAYCLSSIFYYVMVQLSAMLLLTGTGLFLIADKRGGSGHGFFAVACGAIHALHFGFSVYQNYIK